MTLLPPTRFPRRQPNRRTRSERPLLPRPWRCRSKTPSRLRRHRSRSSSTAAATTTAGSWVSPRAGCAFNLRPSMPAPSASTPPWFTSRTTGSGSKETYRRLCPHDFCQRTREDRNLWWRPEDRLATETVGTRDARNFWRRPRTAPGRGTKPQLLLHQGRRWSGLSLEPAHLFPLGRRLRAHRLL